MHLIVYQIPGVRFGGALRRLVAGTVVMLAVGVFQLAAWQWYVLIGSLVTCAAGILASRVTGEHARSGS